MEIGRVLPLMAIREECYGNDPLFAHTKVVLQTLRLPIVQNHGRSIPKISRNPILAKTHFEFVSIKLKHMNADGSKLINA